MPTVFKCAQNEKQRAKFSLKQLRSFGGFPKLGVEFFACSHKVPRVIRVPAKV